MESMDQIPHTNQSATSEAITTAPPPPTEVKIRTMKSDLEGLAASGGGLPKFENVRVAGLSLEKGPDAVQAAHRSNAVFVIIVTIIALGILAALGYFGYKILTGGTF